MKWQIVKPEQIPALARKMEGWDAVVLDMETTGPGPYIGTLPIGMGLGPLTGDTQYYIPIDSGRNGTEISTIDLALLDPIIRVLERKPLVGHNVQYELYCLTLLGWKGTQEAFYDTIVMARLGEREAHPFLDLKAQSNSRLGYEYRFPEVVKKVKNNRAVEVDPRQLAYYCCEDIMNTRGLYHFYKASLSKPHLRLFGQECLLTHDLFDMSQRGIEFDSEYLDEAREKMDIEIATQLAFIRDVTDEPEFNPGSPKQMGALMDKIGIKPVKLTPKGNASWKRDYLLEVRHLHPAPLAIAKYNALNYQRSNIVERCLVARAAGNPEVHFDYKNWGTITGRLSSNAQQMPDGWLQYREAEERGEEVLKWVPNEDNPVEKEFAVRRILKPREGHVMFKSDYSQIEMFVLGDYIQDPTFTKWLESEDVHAAAAFDVWGIGPDHPQAKAYRKMGKEFNFSVVYGIGVKTLSQRLGCTLAEAKTYKKDYFKRAPGYPTFMRKVEYTLDKDGFVTNKYGRQYYLDPTLAYKAVNYLVQGSAGDFVKSKMPETRELRAQIGINMLSTTHDDFIFEVAEENISGVPEFIRALRPSPFGRELNAEADWSRDNLVELRPMKELELVA